MTIRNTQKLRRLLSVMLCIVLLLCAIPTVAYGASSTSIGALTLSTTRNLSGKGYIWNAKTRTLTLENANLFGSIHLPRSGNVTILLKGENTIIAPTSSQGSSGIYTFSRDLKNVTIKGDGTGSLTIEGFFYISGTDTLRIEDCVFSVNSDNFTGNLPNTWGTFASTGTTYITNSQLYLSDGMNLGGEHIIKNSYLQIGDDNIKRTYMDVDGNLQLLDNSELHIEMHRSDSTALEIKQNFYADPTSVVEIINEQGDHCMNVGGNLNLQSECLYLSAKSAVIYTSIHTSDLNVEWSYPKSITLPDGAKYEGSIEDLAELDYTAPSYTERMERIKKGVEATTITLRSTYTAKKNIRLTWKKSPGCRMDYYEVFRSTKRSSDFTKKAFYTTAFGLNNTYTNTKTTPGTTYYYKVRGAREIDGETYYTQWSTKAWRKAK